MGILEFERLVRIGLGRAIIILQENDPRPLGDVILNACLHDLNSDSGGMRSRAQYVWDLIQL